jgi:hypothetical protein
VFCDIILLIEVRHLIKPQGSHLGEFALHFIYIS